jgi:excisionase family DNA binding protein
VNDLRELPQLLTVKDMAKLLKVSSITVRRLANNGELPCVRIHSLGSKKQMIRFISPSVRRWILELEIDAE